MPFYLPQGYAADDCGDWKRDIQFACRRSFSSVEVTYVILFTRIRRLVPCLISMLLIADQPCDQVAHAVCRAMTYSLIIID